VSFVIAFNCRRVSRSANCSAPIKGRRLGLVCKRESDPFQKAEYERLSLAFSRLAEMADRNSQTDVVYESPPAAVREQPAQQQQQPQPKDPNAGNS
jgi:hypothetical protein